MFHVPGPYLEVPRLVPVSYGYEYGGVLEVTVLHRLWFITSNVNSKHQIDWIHKVVHFLLVSKFMLKYVCMFPYVLV